VASISRCWAKAGFVREPCHLVSPAIQGGLFLDPTLAEWGVGGPRLGEPACPTRDPCSFRGGDGKEGGFMGKGEERVNLWGEGPRILGQGRGADSFEADSDGRRGRVAG
jgi:hypothetical protein